MEKEQPKWKRISKGEKMPCWGFLMRMDGTITNVTAMGTTIGQDAYYLPSDSLLDTIKDFPKEESEDERIINNIKKVIGWYRGMFTEKSLMPEEYQEIDAWLEKQGEQKPTNWLQELEDKLANATPQQLAEWKEKYFKEEPAEWSKEDERMYKAISIALTLKDAKRYLSTWYKTPEEADYWLKSLKDRVQPQPKQEWSEEDRKMMRNIIDDIHCGTNFNPKVMHAANEREKWFKSICMRYQSKWKPSEEQITVINDTIRFIEDKSDSLSSDYLYNKMKELLEQLKAL